MMLMISKELAEAFETSTLGRWKSEFARQLRRQYPAAAPRFPDDSLDEWVRSAMEVIRRIGATSRDDMEIFCTALFWVTEAEPDDRAAGDLVAIMTSEGSLAARMALMRKSFPNPPQAA